MSSSCMDHKLKMKFQLFVLFCCALQAIYGAKNEKLSADFRIVNGENAADGLAPYMCSLQKQRLNLCGCAIISHKFVLTAAHCVYGKPESMLEVLVGTYDLKKLTAFSFYYQVEKFDVHAEFAGQKKYDIAAVRVQGEIQYNDYVQPIALLKDSDIPKLSPVLFTGFGRLQLNGERPNHMQTFNAHTIDTELCKNTPLKPIINESHLCILNKKGTGVCHGDSGGPLVWNNKLAGIASMVVVPCAAGLPDIFVKVPFFYDWIQEHTKI